MSFKVSMHADAIAMLKQLDKSIKERIVKRIGRMRDEPVGRHMKHGLDFFVEEIGQCRIVYVCESQEKLICFVGTHKEYEKWYSEK